MILFEKYGQHQPLNRQAERYDREDVDLSLSTLADQVGGCTVVLHPIYDLIYPEAARRVDAQLVTADGGFIAKIAGTDLARHVTLLSDWRPE